MISFPELGTHSHHQNLPRDHRPTWPTNFAYFSHLTLVAEFTQPPLPYFHEANSFRLCFTDSPHHRSVVQRVVRLQRDPLHREARPPRVLQRQEQEQGQILESGCVLLNLNRDELTQPWSPLKDQCTKIHSPLLDSGDLPELPQLHDRHLQAQPHRIPHLHSMQECQLSNQ